MSPITDNQDREDQLTELEAEREHMKAYVAERKPYWMNLRNPWDGQLQWELNNYAPLAHYDLAIADIREQREQ